MKIITIRNCQISLIAAMLVYVAEENATKGDIYHPLLLYSYIVDSIWKSIILIFYLLVLLPPSQSHN